MTLFGLDIGPVTCRGVTVFIDSLFSTTKTSIMQTNSEICVKNIIFEVNVFYIPPLTSMEREINGREFLFHPEGQIDIVRGAGHPPAVRVQLGSSDQEPV